MQTIVKGVIIRPDGDVSNHHLSRFADKYVLRSDPIFMDTRPTQTSVLLELPLLVQRLNDREIIPGDAYHKNRPATFLQMCPHSGFAPLDWQRKIGPVLVVRMDRKPLSCLHLEAIWRYHWALMSEVNSIGWEHGTRARLTRKAFEMFWYEYRKRQIEAGREDFEDFDSPYNV